VPGKDFEETLFKKNSVVEFSRSGQGKTEQGRVREEKIGTIKDDIHRHPD